MPLGRHPGGAATRVPRTISRSGSSARTRNDVLAATLRSGTWGGGLRMLSGPGRPKRRSHVSLRNKAISSAVTDFRERYTCSFGAVILMEWNSRNWYTGANRSSCVRCVATRTTLAGRDPPITTAMRPSTRTSTACLRVRIARKDSGRRKDAPPRNAAIRPR